MSERVTMARNITLILALVPQLFCYSAETIRDNDGVVYENVDIVQVTPTHLTFSYVKANKSRAGASVKLANLPENLQTRFNYSPEKAQVYREQNYRLEAIAREKMAAEVKKEEQRRAIYYEQVAALERQNRERQYAMDVAAYNQQVAESERRNRENRRALDVTAYNRQVAIARQKSYATTWTSYDPNSLLNPYGAGSPYKSDGLMNPYSQYGSKYSNKSWQNPYATDAPKLYDANGKYLGKLSSNKYDLDSTANEYGRYGSKYSPDSINNPYGAGNPFNPKPIYVVPSK